MAVDLRQPLKDAFIQYRSICHHQNVASFEKMIKKYHRMAENRVKKAEENEGELKNRKYNNVELEDTLDSILQRALSGEDQNKDTYYKSLLPWLKYLWDTYRTILLMIRNNIQLEILYHSIVRQAFKFCRQYHRHVEFRNLCDILRHHITNISNNQYKDQNNSINLQTNETQRLYLETRFQQLQVASELELWQEAYRTIEDIYENMQLSITIPPPSLMTVYYDKLSRIFWSSNNYLFHAYSLFKYFILASSIKSEKELTADERRQWATSIVLATLVIPVDKGVEYDNLPTADTEGNIRLAKLLGFQKEIPTRTHLLQNVVPSILNDASIEGQKIYHLLENKCNLLLLTAQISPLLDTLEKDEVIFLFLCFDFSCKITYNRSYQSICQH